MPPSLLQEPRKFSDASSDDPRAVLQAHGKNMSLAGDIRRQLVSLINVIKNRQED